MIKYLIVTKLTKPLSGLSVPKQLGMVAVKQVLYKWLSTSLRRNIYNFLSLC